MRKVIIFSLIIVLETTVNINAQTVGEPAPDFTVDLLGGGEFTLSNKSGKVVLIFFFGNGCPFCVTSGPNVQALYESYENNEEFVAIGLDTWNSSSTENSVANFQSNSGVMFPLAIKAGSVSTAYSSTYDRLVVVDKNGILRHKGGGAAGNDADNASEVIEKFLARTTGITEIPGDNLISVFPNPATESLQVNADLFDGASFEFSLYDITGRERKNIFFDINDGTESLLVDLKDLASGVYLYKMTGKNHIEAGTLLIR